MIHKHKTIDITDFDWFDQIDGHLEAKVYGYNQVLRFTSLGLRQLLKVAAIWGFCVIPGKLIKKEKKPCQSTENATNVAT